jgi:hypothetical protein
VPVSCAEGSANNAYKYDKNKQRKGCIPVSCEEGSTNNVPGTIQQSPSMQKTTVVTYKKPFFFLDFRTKHWHIITKHRNSRASSVSSCLFLGIAIPPLSPALSGLFQISAVELNAPANEMVLELSEFWASGPWAHDRWSPLDCPHPFARQPSRACGNLLPARASRSRRRNSFRTF